MMRIITGKARGVRLNTLQGDQTRPTSERAKEAVFSSLQFDLMGARVLDLFAGSGQLGLEAVSRGAQGAVLCDLSKDAIGIIRSNVCKTGLDAQCRVICGDYSSILKNYPQKKAFDLVFLDPPYANGLVPHAIELLLKHDLLSDKAKIVCETASPEDVFGSNTMLANRFDILKIAKYGIAYVTVLQFLEELKGDKL